MQRIFCYLLGLLYGPLLAMPTERIVYREGKNLNVILSQVTKHPSLPLFAPSSLSHKPPSSHKHSIPPLRHKPSFESYEKSLKRSFFKAYQDFEQKDHDPKFFLNFLKDLKHSTQNSQAHSQAAKRLFSSQAPQWNRYLKKISLHFDKFSASSLVAFITSIAYLNKNFSEFSYPLKLIEELEDAFFLSDDYNASDLSRLFFAFKALQVIPTLEFQRQWLFKAYSKLPAFDLTSLIHLFYAIALFRDHLAPEFKGFESQVLERLKVYKDELDLQTYSTLFYSYALKGQKPHPLFIESYLSFLERQGFRHATDSDVHQLYLARQRLDLPFLIPSYVLPLFLKRIREQKAQRSSFERVIQSYMQKILTPMSSKDTWIEETASYVDLFYPSLRLIIQVDGPRHFFEKMPGLDEVLSPQDELLDAILRSACYHVVRIPYSAWKGLKTEKEKLNFLKRMLK
jgi:very-short-patch-repair endonuclease